MGGLITDHVENIHQITDHTLKKIESHKISLVEIQDILVREHKANISNITNNWDNNVKLIDNKSHIIVTDYKEHNYKSQVTSSVIVNLLPILTFRKQLYVF